MKKVFLLLLVICYQSISAQNKENYVVMLNDDTVYFDELLSITHSGEWANGISIRGVDGKKVKIKNKEMKGYHDKYGFVVMSDDDFQYTTIFRNPEYYLAYRSFGDGYLTKNIYVIVGIDRKTVEISRDKGTADFILKYFNECEVFNKELAKFKTESQKGQFPSKRFHELLYSHRDLCK